MEKLRTGRSAPAGCDHRHRCHPPQSPSRWQRSTLFFGWLGILSTVHELSVRLAANAVTCENQVHLRPGVIPHITVSSRDE
jgi:hypothetical protein